MPLPIKSGLYDEYWRFAYQRQEIFFNRFVKLQHSLSDSSILKKYKFTNCYRCCDRVSQFLIKNIIYSGVYSKEDTFFRIILFKLFNKIETWLFLEDQLGDISINNFDVGLLDSLIAERMKNNCRIYSAAYIMPSGKKEFGFSRKHLNNLHLLQLMLDKNMHVEIWQCASLQQIYECFLALPTIGPFLALQFSIDIAYSNYSNANESDFVVAGPGAIRGIKKCFDDDLGWSSQDIIRYMTDIQHVEFARLGLDFKYLSNRKLQLIDCQNIFCETDKYCRVKHPDIVVGNRRIKQHYRPQSKFIDFYFPPKWKAGLPTS